MFKKWYGQILEFLLPAQARLEEGLSDLNPTLIRAALKRGAQVNTPLPSGMLPLSYLFETHAYHLSLGMKGGSHKRKFREVIYQNRSSQYRMVLELLLEAGADANQKDSYGLNALSYLITFFESEFEEASNSLNSSSTTLHPHPLTQPHPGQIPAYMSPLLTWFPQTTALDILKWMDMFPKMHRIQWVEEIDGVLYQGWFEVQKNLIDIIKRYQTAPLDWSSPMILRTEEARGVSYPPNLVHPRLTNHGRCFALAELGSWDEIWKNEAWNIQVRNQLTGHTLLHLASLEYPPNPYTVERLLQKGVDPTLQNHCGHTAKDLVVAQSSQEVEFLLDAHDLNEALPTGKTSRIPQRI